MARSVPVFKSAFRSPDDEFNGRGIRPVVFDVLAPDGESILPDGFKLVLHVNPRSMQFSYEKTVERIQTEGGFVEQHWGTGTESISFTFATGGFMRLHTGLIGTTGGGPISQGGTRRDTIAYDVYLDLLALFFFNGTIWDANGNPVYQGTIKCSFDGDYWLGWFNSFGVSESADQPYQFELTAEFTVQKEVMKMRTTRGIGDPNFSIQDETEIALTDRRREIQLNRATEVSEETSRSSPGWELNNG